MTSIKRSPSNKRPPFRLKFLISARALIRGNTVTITVTVLQPKRNCYRDVTIKSISDRKGLVMVTCGRAPRVSV